MADICLALDLEIGDEFIFKPYPELILCFTNTELIVKTNKDIYITSGSPIDYDAGNILCNMIKQGKEQIIKSQWMPKKDETYFTFSYTYPNDKDIWSISDPISWCGCAIDYALFKQGWVYRTRDGARKALPAIAEALSVKYEV